MCWNHIPIDWNLLFRGKVLCALLTQFHRTIKMYEMWLYSWLLYFSFAWYRFISDSRYHLNIPIKEVPGYLYISQSWLYRNYKIVLFVSLRARKNEKTPQGTFPWWKTVFRMDRNTLQSFVVQQKRKLKYVYRQ